MTTVKDPFSIIVFRGPKQNGKKPVDMVLSTWLYKQGKKHFCKYPPPELYHMRDIWLEEGKIPEDSWEAFRINVFTTAKSLEQGRRRLDRTCQQNYADSTDSEYTRSFSLPYTLSKSKVIKELRKTYPMSSKDSSSKGKISLGEFSKKLKIDSSVTDSENDEPLRRVTNKYSRILEAKNNSSESSNNEESPSFCVINDSSNKTEGLLENSVSSQQEKFLSASQSPEKSNEKENDIDKVRRESLKRKLYYRSDVMSKGEEDTPSSSKKKVVSADILEAVRQSVRDAMRSVVKSIQIDLRKSTDEVKNLIISKNMALVHGPNVTITREKLNVVVPIKSLDEFLQYEDLLQKNKEERNTLLSFFRILIYSLTTEKDCVAAILPAMLTKNVQLEYSGVGRAIHGEAKRNFSATQMCTILKDATIEKLGSAGNLKTLQTIISRWLSGAGDRDGGRKNR